MWLDNASASFVDEFWRRAGNIEAFPRDLERALAFALPLAVVKLPRLHLGDIEAWLRRKSVRFAFDCESRAVRGCLVAFRGFGIIFLDGTDPDEERRFTLAHEIAHFMRDYWGPRREAIGRLGGEVLEVLDGSREATVPERVRAALSGMTIGVATDLMERSQSLDDISGKLWSAEDRADRIALALLAPPQAVARRTDISAPQYQQREKKLSAVLRTEFGLPAGVAKSYSHQLLAGWGKGRSWLESVGLR